MYSAGQLYQHFFRRIKGAECFGPTLKVQLPCPLISIRRGTDQHNIARFPTNYINEHKERVTTISNDELVTRNQLSVARNKRQNQYKYNNNKGKKEILQKSAKKCIFMTKRRRFPVDLALSRPQREFSPFTFYLDHITG